MKSKSTPIPVIALGIFLCAADSHAQLVVPSDGSDGALNVTSNTVIDLSLATTNHDWTYNNSGNVGNGVYDGTKWAVVFKYASVNIASNATVTFLNHPSHAPVVWLVQSNVVVNGAVHLDGQTIVSTYPDYLAPTEPGPGGFRGGASSASSGGSGYGPGGGGLYGASYGSGYGNPQILPLMGGSGGYGGEFYGGGPFAGPSPGGAILIAGAGTVTINGQVTALGRTYSAYALNSGGSGDGAIRLVANQVLGNGAVNAGGGRTRVEANSISSQLALTPNTVAVPPGTTPVIWPATNAPIVTVLSVNAVSAPADPQGGVSTSSDLAISTNNPVGIILQSQNFPPSGTIVVRVTPKYGNYYNVNATNVSGTFSSAIWKATATLPNGFCVLQAHATSP